MNTKKLTLELSYEDYVTLLVAVSHSQNYYTDLYRDCDSRDEELAARCDVRLASLERLDHVLQDSGEWV